MGVPEHCSAIAIRHIVRAACRIATSTPSRGYRFSNPPEILFTT